MRKLRGFTLVELLVVIGIIAVLISILLPSLAKARQHANNVLCSSNLRSVGQGLLFYANEHKGKLPFSGSGDWVHLWPFQVGVQMGATLTPKVNDQWGNFDGEYPGVMRCPDAPPESRGVAWNGGFHYTANCRAMPDVGGFDKVKNRTFDAYPLGTKNSSAKMLMWDGPLLPDFGWNAPTNNHQQNWAYLDWGATNPSWCDPTPGWEQMATIAPIAGDGSYNSMDPANAKYMGKTNRDGGADNTEFPWSQTTFGFQRYRHLGDTSANFLFFDGHVEARKLGEVTIGDLSIFPW